MDEVKSSTVREVLNDLRLISENCRRTCRDNINVDSDYDPDMQVDGRLDDMLTSMTLTEFDRGKSGVLYVGRSPNDTYVIKVLSSSLDNDEGICDRGLVYEAHVGKLVNSLNDVNFIHTEGYTMARRSIGQDVVIPYLFLEPLMDYVEYGQFIQYCLSDRTEYDILEVLYQVSVSIIDAYERIGFTHNDLHQSNVLVLRRQSSNERCRVKIIDLGMSRIDQSVLIDDQSRTSSDQSRTVDDNPTSIYDQSRAVDDNPTSIYDQSRSTSDQSRTVDDKPTLVDNQPRTIQGQSRIVDDQSRTVDDKPTLAPPDQFVSMMTPTAGTDLYKLVKSTLDMVTLRHERLVYYRFRRRRVLVIRLINMLSVMMNRGIVDDKYRIDDDVSVIHHYASDTNDYIDGLSHPINYRSYMTYLHGIMNNLGRNRD